MSDDFLIRSAKLSATISPHGAELRTIKDAAGRDLLSDGPPAFWTGRAPLLFPIVGRLIGNHYRLAGKTYEMAQHGFARSRHWAKIAHDESSITLSLEADDETQAHYPFDFLLAATVSIDAATLTFSVRVENRGAAPMPASFGFHPAFRWPLPDGGDRSDYEIRFAKEEPEPIRRLAADGGIAPADVPTPIEGHVLRLRDDLFTNDAIILEAPRSRSVRYGAPGERGLEVSFPAMPMLGIWTKPGAPFLCIEPWHGHADPEGFAGDLFEKPGIIAFAPGEARTFSYSVGLFEADEGWAEQGYFLSAT